MMNTDISMSQFSAAVKARVWQNYGGKGVAQCWWCGGVATEIDHVVPLAAGGPSDIDNAAPICMPCNRNPNVIRPLSATRYVSGDVVEIVAGSGICSLRRGCRVRGCRRAHSAKGLCERHWNRDHRGYKGKLDAPFRPIKSGVACYEGLLAKNRRWYWKKKILKLAKAAGMERYPFSQRFFPTTVTQAEY